MVFINLISHSIKNRPQIIEIEKSKIRAKKSKSKNRGRKSENRAKKPQRKAEKSAIVVVFLFLTPCEIISTSCFSYSTS
jgi:hypothetical protein